MCNDIIWTKVRSSQVTQYILFGTRRNADYLFTRSKHVLFLYFYNFFVTFLPDDMHTYLVDIALDEVDVFAVVDFSLVVLDVADVSVVFLGSTNNVNYTIMN